jgi:hypothetical protein
VSAMARLARLVGRKVYGFTVVMSVCGIDAWRHGITWPCAAVMALCFVGFVLGVSGEKILGVAKEAYRK